MAGIGKYKKGKAFKLKSGNSPLFKHMGSPITMNNFGIGQGSSPYKGKYSTTDDPNMVENVDELSQSKAKKKKGTVKKIAATGLAALTSGLDAVYGSGKIMPDASAKLFKKKKDDEEVEKDNPEKKVDDLTTKKPTSEIIVPPMPDGAQ